RGLQKPAGLRLKPEPCVRRIRSQADHKILVRHGRMELHRAATATKEFAPHLLRHSRLSCSWRSLEDHEPPRAQQVVDLLCRDPLEQTLVETPNQLVVL